MQKAFRFIILFSLVLFWLANTASAQDMITISGNVVDQDGEPLPSVQILQDKTQSKVGTVTNGEGDYQLKVPADQFVNIIYRYIGYYTDTVSIYTDGDKTINLTLIPAEIVLPDVVVQDVYIRDEPSTVKLNVKTLESLPTPFQGIESIIRTQGLGVNTTNELSSAYSVRGGNFDENLVYVNDFEVYRPFLIRSGQQEGLSFINSNLVSDVSFSSGGFQAKYGDKMSSVLDVTYKRPKEFGGSVSLSLLGGSAHLEGASDNSRLTWMVGVRQQSSQYILNSQDVKGQYQPSFIDVQSFLTFNIRENIDLEFIATYARNRFRFEPVDRETTFGVVNNVLRLTMFFEGQENDTYDSYMSGVSISHKHLSDRLKFKWLSSVYRTKEVEAFDIIGEYFLGEVETDFSQEDFGQTVFSLGAGTIHDFTRNELEATILQNGHRGFLFAGAHHLQWGFDYKVEMIDDVLREWQRLDSAGYSLPYNEDNVLVSSVLKSDFQLNSHRINGYIQDTWRFGDSVKTTLNYGMRFGYWSVNKEFFATPRVQLSINPNWEKDVVFKASAGLYYQPPFYREMRNLQGVVNTDLLAQKSMHVVIGADLNFKIWDRPFKFITEIYYKQMWDLVPYEFDNVLIRYFGDNLSRGYSAGIDLRLHGEFVPGAESWISMSVMQTQEDILGDQVTVYFDADGNNVPNTADNADIIVDTSVIKPGRVPRPTDQRVTFGLFFQDYIPKNENFKVHLNLLFGTGLPFGPPDSERYADTLRIPPYRRLDIGFSALLFDRNRKETPPKSFFRHIKSIWATLEVWNLLGVQNTISYLWVRDVTNTSYAVPNYLTNRRFNVRLVVKF